MNAVPRIGADAVAAKGWFVAHRWLLARRASQLGILALFLLGPLAGIWIVKGNLSYSLTLGVLHLADPYVLLQSLLAGNVPEQAALIGGAIVLAFYFLVGGRVYCSWVCPLNIVTDAARWLRDRLGIPGAGARISASTRYWLLGLTLVLAAFTGTLVWEMVNPVSMLHRGLLYGMGTAWLFVAGVFLFDLFVSRQGWCGHVCPVGAFYSLVNRWCPLKVNAAQSDRDNFSLGRFDAIFQIRFILEFPRTKQKTVVKRFARNNEGVVLHLAPAHNADQFQLIAFFNG